MGAVKKILNRNRMQIGRVARPSLRNGRSVIAYNKFLKIAGDMRNLVSFKVAITKLKYLYSFSTLYIFWNLEAVV